MIIPRHKECDFCGEPVGVNKRYFIIKSKNYLVGYAGSCSDNITHHICEDCMYEFEKYLQSKLRGEECSVDKLDNMPMISKKHKGGAKNE